MAPDDIKQCHEDTADLDIVSAAWELFERWRTAHRLEHPDDDRDDFDLIDTYAEEAIW